MTWNEKFSNAPQSYAYENALRLLTFRLIIFWSILKQFHSMPVLQPSEISYKLNPTVWREYTYIANNIAEKYQNYVECVRETTEL